MLEQLLMHLNNWFLVPGGIHTDTYTIEAGGITLPFLQNGQYFRICGSVFNDGLYKYPTDNLTSEKFYGAVWALAVPAFVVKISEEIEAWQEKNAAIVTSPYTSESFGGYSYTKASAGASDTSVNSWQDAFRSQLNQWRKI